MESRPPLLNWLPILLTSVLCIGLFLGFRMAKYQGYVTTKLSTHTPHYTLDQVQSFIESRYVDTISGRNLIMAGIEGMLNQLDPHSVYIPASRLDAVNEELQGAFYGIGVEFYTSYDTITLSSMVPGGPADQAGLKVGDKILKIDTQLVAGKPLEDEEIIRYIRGKANTKVSLQILRSGTQIKEIKITRKEVSLPSIPAYFMLSEQTGLIKINVFSETTYDEFVHALQMLKKQGLKNLFLDLRDNPGGYMDAATRIADEFVDGTHTILYTRNKLKSDSIVTHTKGAFEQGQLFVFINENSASSSEILAGILQDMDRATLIGNPSFGKGLVQEQIELPDRSAIRLTTARYYLPSGRSIQRSYPKGKMSSQDLSDYFRIHKPGKHDSLHRYYTARHKVVYAHEGIHPDILIPLDTLYDHGLDTFYQEHAAEEFAVFYNNIFSDRLQEYQHEHQFASSFQLNPKELQALTHFLIRYGIKPAFWSMDSRRKEILQNVKAQIARIKFGRNGLFRVEYQDDRHVVEAMKQIK